MNNLNPYQPPVPDESQDQPHVEMESEMRKALPGLKRVRIGLLAIYYSTSMFLLFFLVMPILGFVAFSFISIHNLNAICVSAISVGWMIGVFVGLVLCAEVPRQTTARLWGIASLVLYLLFVFFAVLEAFAPPSQLSVNSSYQGVLPVPRMTGLLLPMGMFSFLLFLKRISTFLQSQKLQRSAQRVIYVFGAASIAMITFVMAGNLSITIFPQAGPLVPISIMVCGVLCLISLMLIISFTKRTAYAIGRLERESSR